MDNAKVSLVIVEDHLVTLDGLASQLGAQADFVVLGKAADLRSGIELVRQSNPDVVLLDLHLPDSQGPKSLLAAFRAFFDGKIVIFSGEDREPFLEVLIESGADACIHKSKSAEYVGQRIRELVAGSASIRKRASKDAITKAEREVLTLLARGLRYQEIAEARGTTAETVRKQCDRLQIKLEMKSRESLIAWAVQQGYAAIDS